MAADLGVATAIRPCYGKLDREKPRGQQEVYTYICGDGVVRTRCAQHALAGHGTTHGIPRFIQGKAALEAHLGRAHRGACVECTWNLAVDQVVGQVERAEVE